MEAPRVGREARCDVREVKESPLRYTLLQACLPAALLALEDVNNNKDILTNYHINLAAKDDEVSVCPH